MCVTNVYVDRYPDGKEVEFRQTTYCENGKPAAGLACSKLSTFKNPTRNIQFGERTTEYILTDLGRVFPQIPPRSTGGPSHSYAGDGGDSEGRRRTARLGSSETTDESFKLAGLSSVREHLEYDPIFPPISLLLTTLCVAVNFWTPT
jgi:hypothetical protein